MKSNFLHLENNKYFRIWNNIFYNRLLLPIFLQLNLLQSFMKYIQFIIPYKCSVGFRGILLLVVYYFFYMYDIPSTIKHIILINIKTCGNISLFIFYCFLCATLITTASAGIFFCFLFLNRVVFFIHSSLSLFLENVSSSFTTLYSKLVF